MGLFDSIGKVLYGDPGKGTDIARNDDAEALFNNVFGSLAGNATEGLGAGFGEIMNLLNSTGEIDPRLKLRQQQSIQRGTRANQQTSARDFARRGLGNSGVGAAIQAAIGQAGAGQVADREAQDAQIQEQTKRQDRAQGLQSLMQMFLPSASQAHGVERGVDLGRAQVNLGRNQLANEQAKQSQDLIGDIIGSIFGGFMCVVAEELYGKTSDKFYLARKYMFTKAPMELRMAYIKNGPKLVERIKVDPELREEMTYVFDSFVDAELKSREEA